MSHAYSEIRDYGEQVHAVCDECGYRQRFTWIKDANAAARAHNAAHHPVPRRPAISNYT